MNHPLKNSESPHYAIYDGLEGIDVIENVLTTEELIGACKFNILKYQLRLGKKGSLETVQSDLKKIATYQAYLRHLSDLLQNEQIRETTGASAVVSFEGDA